MSDDRVDQGKMLAATTFYAVELEGQVDALRAEVAALRRALEYSQLCVLGMSRRYHELARHKKPFEGCWRCPKGDAALATRGGDASG